MEHLSPPLRPSVGCPPFPLRPHLFSITSNTWTLGLPSSALSVPCGRNVPTTDTWTAQFLSLCYSKAVFSGRPSLATTAKIPHLHVHAHMHTRIYTHAYVHVHAHTDTLHSPFPASLFPLGPCHSPADCVAHLFVNLLPMSPARI